MSQYLLAIATVAHLLALGVSATAAPFEIEGYIKQVRTVETRPPYTFDGKPVVSVYIVGHRYGRDFDYQYMVVQDATQLEGISFAELVPGKYVRVKSRAEPPGMVGRPIQEVRDSRFGCCNFAVHMDTARTPRNITASITRVDSLGPTEAVVTVRHDTGDAPEYQYLVVDGKTIFRNGGMADLKASARVDIAQAGINVPVASGVDHGKLHGADLFAGVVTMLKGPHIMTVAGPIDAASAGVALSHEHVLVDFVGADGVGPHRYDTDKVFEEVRPHLARAHELGARLFVDCTPQFLGRDPQLLRRLGEATGLRILTNTGLYGARNGKFLPPYVASETAEQLAARWIAEARDGIEGTGIRPGFVKCGVNPDPELSAVDRKLVEAAALTHRATGLPVAVHTGAGPGLAQIEILKAYGVTPAAWIWVHAQDARDADILAAAKQGAWLSFDGLSPQTMNRHLDLCRMLRDNKRLDQVLISHDAGWYDPAKPEGGTFREFDLLFTQFLPALRQAEFTEGEIHQLVTANPARAFAVAQPAEMPALVRVARWQPHDFAFRCDAKVENPFAVPFSVEVSGPNGIRFTQPGFHDGDGVWKARVAPSDEGRWTLLTRSSLPALDQQSVVFECGPEAKPGPTFTSHHGALRVDRQHPRHFVFDDGTPFFLMGYECDWLWALDMGQPELKTLDPFLDKLVGHGFNYVVLNAYAHDTDWRPGNTTPEDHGPPPLFAWAGSNEQPDHSRLNVAYWRHYDRVIESLRQRGMIAHIMFKVYNKKVNWPANGSENDDRYFRWLIARYAAFPNVHWDFSKEAWKEEDMAYKVNRLQFVRDHDAYRRPVTVHDGRDMYDPGAAAAGLLDYRSVQCHGGWHATVLTHRQQREWPVVMVEFGYEQGPGGPNDKTWGMSSTPEEICQRAWEIYMAGGYGVYYYTYTGWDMIRTQETPPGYAYLKHLRSFFQRTDFRRLGPADELVSDGYCLADRGREYVVFQNKAQPFTLKVEGLSGPIPAQWFNPLTGEYRDGVALTNGTVQLTPPEAWAAGPVALRAQ